MDSAPKDKTAEHGRQPSASELLASAKLVAEAAQASLGNGRDKIDKVKVAAAAEDLLGAASKYGKVEEKGLGQYIEKAENYLHHYHSGSQPITTTTSTTGSGHTATLLKNKNLPSRLRLMVMMASLDQMGSGELSRWLKDSSRELSCKENANKDDDHVDHARVDYLLSFVPALS
ncbi:hypothetical protein OIU85_006248 [Salix viminalis]|uniref:Uncharacterized protein n=1 Tax=Salix viminalis TaxID=40686 RepID=A0A9Q0SUK4_SALVM|nr:hypothetical protein OIU85_006248 [Salix viminalis]